MGVFFVFIVILVIVGVPVGCLFVFSLYVVMFFVCAFFCGRVVCVCLFLFIVWRVLISFVFVFGLLMCLFMLCVCFLLCCSLSFSFIVGVSFVLLF